MMRKQTKRALGLVAGIWFVVALPLLTSLVYGEHDRAGTSAIVFILFITFVIMLLVFARAEKRVRDKRVGESTGLKIGPPILLPSLFAILGAVLTRIYGHLYLIFGISTFAAWTAFIVVLGIAYSRSSQEEREAMPLPVQIILSFNVLFLMAVTYGLTLVLIYIGEPAKLRNLF